MTAVDKQRRKMAVENMYKMYLKYYPAMKEDIKAYIEDKAKQGIYMKDAG